MKHEILSQGSLFISDFLTDAIKQLPEWREISEIDLAEFEEQLKELFSRFASTTAPNESSTENELVWPILRCLGWDQTLRQQNLSSKGRDDVPDGLLFLDQKDKTAANARASEWERYLFGVAIVEVKRWGRPLDRSSGKLGEQTAPSSQMLRYLRRIDDVAKGSLHWGLLTNGSKWRLYYSRARSVSEQFFELDLGQILGISEDKSKSPLASIESRGHWLKVFLLVFRQKGFVPNGIDARSFHERAIEQGRFYEERVAGDLSNKVFGIVFPALVHAIHDVDGKADLNDVREAALILLYRLLFVLYAEDRDLLPTRDPRYDKYGLRHNVRLNVGKSLDKDEKFSDTVAKYWSVLTELFKAIDKGDKSIGLPPYNGGLFDQERTPLLKKVHISDAVMSNIIDSLSFEQTKEGRKYINYRNLSVQQLGSIYERLLEYDVVLDGEKLEIRPNVFARKKSGSYYTPDDLVQLILSETMQPLITSIKADFHSKIEELGKGELAPHQKIGQLKIVDPASKLLELKIVDPAMGSGHFLVSLVDFLSDRVIAAMAEAGEEVNREWGDYLSPLTERIDTIRNTILANASRQGFAIDEEQLDDRHIVRRMVLKRCIYGVDKNIMAVELAKVSLWLHTFTVGAPLSFLDHHLRCGDSLFGSWVNTGISKVEKLGTPLLLHEPMQRALRAASKMQIVEGLTDAEIAEAHRSADIFAEIQEMTAPLDSLLSFIHALDWLKLKAKTSKLALTSFFDGEFGDVIEIIRGKRAPRRPKDVGAGVTKQISATEKFAIFSEIFAQAQLLVNEEKFLNWQVAFPGIWSDWKSDEMVGGFDAVIGNPPWDRIKLQQIDWFAARRPEIARSPKAADRAKMVDALVKAKDPLVAEFKRANDRAEATSRMARKGGDYPLLSKGDTNLNSLFAERAARIVSPAGIVGLLIPSGIATEPTSQEFFSNLITAYRASCYFDFFNKRLDGSLFFADVYYRFKFSVFVFSGGIHEFERCRFSTFIRDLAELDEPERVFSMDLDHFRLVNPNTVTAPTYRSIKDREISEKLYARVPILVGRDLGGNEFNNWPVEYATLYHMANNSGEFRTSKELAHEGAWLEKDGKWRSKLGVWAPLYEGKMVQAFDHRASGITTVEGNLYRSGQAQTTTEGQRHDPSHVTAPRYFIQDPGNLRVEVAIKDVTSTTNARSLIACLIPPVGAGHTLPIIRVNIEDQVERARAQAILVALLNSTMVDFIARTKILSNHASWYILEQLPIMPQEVFETRRFGRKTAREIICDAVLELTYTSTDIAEFARNLGGNRPDASIPAPFIWNDARRRTLRAKLDAVFFHIYGVTDRSTVKYIFSTFPIVEKDEIEAFTSYRSRDLCLDWMNALASDQPDANIQ